MANDIGAHEYAVNPNFIIADFDVQPTSGIAPLVVQFADTSQSSNAITSWRWTYDLGSGPIEFSTIANPSLTLNETGFYAIILVVSSPDGEDTIVRQNLLQVHPDTVNTITADFDAQPTWGFTPLVVQFTDTSHATRGITSWRWTYDYGNNPVEFSTDANPSLALDQVGTCTVSLTVTGPDGEDAVELKDLITILPERVGCDGNLLVNSDFSADLTGWQFYSGGNGVIRFEDAAAVVHVQNNGGNTQLYQTPLSVNEGETYQLAFNIRTLTANSSVSIALIQHGAPYANLGLDESVYVTPAGQRVELFFTANASASDARLRIMFGSDATDIFLSDFCMIEAGDQVELFPLTLRRIGTQQGLLLHY